MKLNPKVRMQFRAKSAENSRKGAGVKFLKNMFEKNIMNNDYDSRPKIFSLKKILMIIILLIVLILIAGLIVYLKPSFDNDGRIAEKKADILKRLELFEAGNNPLKTEEKKEIFEALADTKIQEYDFSKEEKIKLLKALNNK